MCAKNPGATSWFNPRDMEPIFYRGDRKDEGFVGNGVHRNTSLLERYHQLHHSHHHRPSHGSNMVGRHSRLAVAPQLERSQHGRGDCLPGVHRMAPVTGHGDSNDDDGETSSASEDSAPSAGYPSPQARAARPAQFWNNKRPAAVYESGAGSNNIQPHPPAQRARIQMKETESAVRASPAWSPSLTGLSIRSGGCLDDNNSMQKQQRQLPRLAALEPPHSSISQPSNQLMHHGERDPVGVNSRPLSVKSLMQLPSLSDSFMSNRIGGTVQSTIALQQVLPTAATSSPRVHPPMLAPPRPLQHDHNHRALPSQHNSTSRSHHSARERNTEVDGQTLRESQPSSPWSYQQQRRQVPRMEGLGASGFRSGSTTAEEARAAAVHLGRLDSVWSAVPTSASGNSFEDKNVSYRVMEQGYARGIQLEERSASWETNRRRENGSPVASGRWGQEATVMRGGSERWLSRGQHGQQEPQAFQDYHEHEERRYVDQQSRTVLRNRRPEATRTPSPVYRALLAPSSVAARALHSAEYPEQGRWSPTKEAHIERQHKQRLQQLPPDGRAGKQILQRYVTCLNPKASREVWSHDEEEVLWRAQHEYGNAWGYIAGLLPGRSENAVKNHWYTQMRMFIGQRGNNIHGRKHSAPANNTAAKSPSNPGNDDNSVPRLTRQPKHEPKKDDEHPELESKLSDSLAPPASIMAAAASGTSTNSAVSSSGRSVAAEENSAVQTESAARAEAVAALGMLFTQGINGDDDGALSSNAGRSSGSPGAPSRSGSRTLLRPSVDSRRVPTARLRAPSNLYSGR